MPKKIKMITEEEAAEIKVKAVLAAQENAKKNARRVGPPRGKVPKKKVRTGQARLTPKQVEMDAKAVQVYQYRVMGYSYRQVGELMGMNPAEVHRWSKRARELRLIDERDQIKEIHMDRIEAMRGGLASAAMSGDVQAIDRMLRLDEREAKLAGFEEAQKVEIIDNTDPRKIMHAELGAIFTRLAMQGIAPGDVGKGKQGDGK